MISNVAWPAAPRLRLSLVSSQIFGCHVRDSPKNILSLQKNQITHTTMIYTTKKELAMAYCPDIDYSAALKKLKQWIRTNTELSARLAATGYIPTQRRFTPQQVKLLFHYLGEPF